MKKEAKRIDALERALTDVHAEAAGLRESLKEIEGDIVEIMNTVKDALYEEVKK